MADGQSKRRWLWALLPAVIFAICIAVTSSTVITSKAFVHAVARIWPGLTEQNFGEFWTEWWWLFVKGWHATEFAILCGVLLKALKGRPVWISALLAAAVAASDEIHQLWVPHRGGRVSDWLIDCLGIGLILALVTLRSRVANWKMRTGYMAIAMSVVLCSLRVLALNPF